ncbi:Uncharacterised protein [Mobiluncus mulieris]|uniref:Uncharacterized protein n=1 Tax=Mobiluncus mulieris TaxID=2052 RepID=A0A8G2HVX2_9ACTO|nr:hypothetical protein [Mobiluncus mulieris]STO23208.1 Uncharacterised protein [Mobiluncus mulieris]
MASEIRDYLLAWARTRVSVCTNHERVSKFWAQFWGFSLARVRKSPPMSVGRSLILEMENTDESGAAGASRGAACDEGIRTGLGLESALGGDGSGGGFGEGDPEPTWLDTGRRSRNTVPGGPRTDVADFAVTAWRRMPDEQHDCEKEFIVLLLSDLEKPLDFRVLHRELPQANPLVTALQTGCDTKNTPHRISLGI